MYLLIASLVSGSASADPLLVQPVCHPPCLGILIGSDGHIMPPDWYEATLRELDGNLNWFRVEVQSYGRIGVSIGDYELGEKFYSRKESDERTSVYYVPAEEGAWISVWGDREGWYSLSIDGAEKAPF